MNITRTPYIENGFLRYPTGYHTFFIRFSSEKRLLAFFKTILQNGFVPVISCAIILVSVAGYIAAINYSMVRGASLKQIQKEIKLVETSVLQKETILANMRTIASLKKQKDIALMENVDGVHYVLPNSASVAEGSGNQAIR